MILFGGDAFEKEKRRTVNDNDSMKFNPAVHVITRLRAAFGNIKSFIR